MAITALRRPVGRPRKNGRPHLTRDAVLLTAAKMISRHGYAGSGIRMLAAALDASPASLFNLFPSKDALLNALIDYVAQPSLAFYAALRALDPDPAAALYKTLYEEARLVASVDQDYPALFYLPELRQPAFAQAQSVRAHLVAHYRMLIEDGCARDLLTCEAPAFAAEQMLQLTETSLLAGAPARSMSPDDQGRATARFCLRGLLRRPQSLDRVEAQALAIDLTIALPEAAY